jgi:hypothetical protein
MWKLLASKTCVSNWPPYDKDTVNPFTKGNGKIYIIEIVYFIVFHIKSSFWKKPFYSTGDSRYTRFAIRDFVYPRFYFSIMRNVSILSAATVEAAAQAR